MEVMPRTPAPRPELSLPKIVAGALAAASAAVASSWLGVAGTVFGAVVVSVVATVGTALSRTPWSGVSTRSKGDDPGSGNPLPCGAGPWRGFGDPRAAASRPPRQDDVRSAGPRPSSSCVATLALGFGALTAFEAVMGQSASELTGSESGGGTTLGQPGRWRRQGLRRQDPAASGCPSHDPFGADDSGYHLASVHSSDDHVTHDHVTHDHLAHVSDDHSSTSTGPTFDRSDLDRTRVTPVDSAGRLTLRQSRKGDRLASGTDFSPSASDRWHVPRGQEVQMKRHLMVALAVAGSGCHGLWYATTDPSSRPGAHGTSLAAADVAMARPAAPSTSVLWRPATERWDTPSPRSSQRRTPTATWSTRPPVWPLRSRCCVRALAGRPPR